MTSGRLDRRLAAHERQLRALELRLAGVSYQQIAQELGYAGRQGAYKAVESALKLTLREPAESLRRLSAERLDRALLAVWRAVVAGEPRAIEAMLRIEARRAKLLGLDAPGRSELSGPEGGPIELATVAQQAREHLAAKLDAICRARQEVGA